MISIIGAGKVGSAIGFLSASASLDDIVLVNRNKNKAMGEALDIVNVVPKNSTISVTGTDDYENIAGSQVVVITVNAGKIVTDRSDLIQYNIPIIKDISKKIERYASNAKVIVITNPVDVITYCILQESGLSVKNVIGMGSSLDSDRFRYAISKTLHTNQSGIESIVLGEHGNSMVPIFSTVKLDGKAIHFDKNQMTDITNEVRNYWRPLTELKGASVFGAAKHSYDIIKAIMKNESLEVPSSVMLHGEYGISDVCMGVPLVINKNGASIKEIDLDDSEHDMLVKSSNVIKNNIKKI
ncbi:Lactate/malate dehydrogenase [Nitrosotalea sinensis]|uniref:Lactate/malate dehydrogenase n=1 Tax=Nitrosotalea sinensis TaxID=1499975 RepID=A0A2H1EG94_9ARCH|nr:lactate dehydrogenase [Candidatus Nitrosotalea sinensis]SHO44773.1 Lactate/malate dehydrogenase [Candidatus Nitrosotalea sinensis]